MDQKDEAELAKFLRMKKLSRGEIISRLQHLPYHHPEARALRAAFSFHLEN